MINRLNSESCLDISNTYKLDKSKKILDINVSEELTELLLEIYNINNVSPIQDNHILIMTKKLFLEKL